MKQLDKKRDVGVLNGTPDKRMYWSIISDYDISTGLCELIDNAIDRWVTSGASYPLNIALELNYEQQFIGVFDNAGGVSREDLRFLVASGASLNVPTAETIGIFGVGSKRAVVALAEAVTIKTRFGEEGSFQIDLDNDWLEAPTWDISYFQIPDIEAGTTTIDLSRLRQPFTERDVDVFRTHVGQTYARFLKNKNCVISINGTQTEALTFDQWAYPSGFPPRSITRAITIEGFSDLQVEITAGLILDRDPAKENYGVYFYCNDRLLVKERRTREVGYYVSSEAGVPHPDASLCRAIVSIQGAARLMPWNSSKSDINFTHPIAKEILPDLIQLVAYFSSLSRRFKNEWDETVFSASKGEIEKIDSLEVLKKKKLALAPLPKVYKHYLDVLKAKNQSTIDDQPWTMGLVEAMAAIDIIDSQKLETKNRIALVLLDSNFEIALKEFIVHREDLFPRKHFNISQLFEKRFQVIDAVTKKILIPPVLINKAKHYYELRNKLIHERATVGVTDADVTNYRDTVESILKLLFGLDFSCT